jgi:hypothetical protein
MVLATDIYQLICAIGAETTSVHKPLHATSPNTNLYFDPFFSITFHHSSSIPKQPQTLICLVTLPSKHIPHRPSPCGGYTIMEMAGKTILS